LNEWVAESLSQTRLTAAMTAVFAVCALLLTAVGIYGVLGYTVASRTKEIGIRVAMGATHPRVIGLVLREGLVWAGGGIAAGLIAAAASAHLMASLLYEIPARDPATFAVVGGTVCLVAVLACAIPAARAMAIDPTLAIRSE
jgi:putative ABC transport system permease protein